MRDLPSPDFRRLFEAAPGLYLVLTPDLHIVAASDAYLRATMTVREEIVGRGIFEVFPDNPEDPSATGVRNLQAALERVLESRHSDAMAVQKYDVRRPDGGFEERHWSPFNSPVLGPNGEVAYIIHRVEDVTEFIRLKRAGTERERLAQALQDRAVKMEAEIYERAQQVAEANRQLTQANETLSSMYLQIARLLTRASDEKRGGKALEDRETIAPAEMLACVEKLIADHSRLEEQLRQSQKMEAVGRFAGGVAHDFNNLLTVISGYASLLRQGPGGATPDLDEIEKAAMRAGALTQKLLAFTRQQVLQPRIINLNSVVGGLEEMLRRLIGEDIHLVTILGSGLGNTKADPTQIEQVIMNLAVNSRDAMPSGGRLIIETRNVRLTGEQHSLPPGEYVLLSVSDTGHGMDAQTASRVFEPFFTTKEIGRGTGLGLSTVYGIVTQSGGTITVNSSPGHGATFLVYLPACAAEAEALPPEQAHISAPARSAAVLLVEDEAPLRNLISKVLSSAGYEVLGVASGEEAVRLASTRCHIDLLITDVVMPGMKGTELVKRLRPLLSEVAVLYMSGYDRDQIDPQALEGAAAFLPKPFTPAALLARISDLLGKRRQRKLGKTRPAAQKRNRNNA